MCAAAAETTPRAATRRRRCAPECQRRKAQYQRAQRIHDLLRVVRIRRAQVAQLAVRAQQVLPCRRDAAEDIKQRLHGLWPLQVKSCRKGRDLHVVQEELLQRVRLCVGLVCRRHADGHQKSQGQQDEESAQSEKAAIERALRALLASSRAPLFVAFAARCTQDAAMLIDAAELLMAPI